MSKIKYKVYHWTDGRGLNRTQAYIQLSDAEKILRRNFTGVNCEADAWRFVFDIVDRSTNGEPLGSLVKPDITLKDFVEEYEPIYLATLRQNAKNIAIVKNRLQKVLEHFGDFALTDITVSAIEKFRFNRGREVSNNTINRDIAALSAMLTGAVKRNYLTNNPCHRVEKLYEDKSIRRLPIYNVAELFKAVWKEQELRDYCLLLYYSGLRCNDAVMLTAENIKTSNGIRYFEVIESKTNKAVIIPIHQALVDNGMISDSGFVFRYSHKRELAVDALSRKFKDWLVKKGFSKDITPYWFRHTFQDTLEANGIAEGTIRHLMGKSLSGSLNYYSHSNIERMRDAVNTLPTYNSFTLFSHKANSVSETDKTDVG